jgi:hypothetical protein
MYELILQTPIQEILNKLGIKYTVLGSSMGLWEWDKLADWRIVNVIGNYVNDFSHDRAKWWPFAFVKACLKLTDRETFEWFKDNFWIVWLSSEKKISHKEIKKWLKIQYHRGW